MVKCQNIEYNNIGVKVICVTDSYNDKKGMEKSY